VPAEKQIISSRSFWQPVTEIADLQDVLAHFITNAALKLRNQDSVAGMIQVFIMTDRFRDDCPQYNPTFSVPLPMASDDTMTLNRWAGRGQAAILREGYQYKKVGVIISARRADPSQRSRYENGND
jgi:DNA polymerase V